MNVLVKDAIRNKDEASKLNALQHHLNLRKQYEINRKAQQGTKSPEQYKAEQSWQRS